LAISHARRAAVAAKFLDEGSDPDDETIEHSFVFSAEGNKPGGVL
jgi:hypothetical protein